MKMEFATEIRCPPRELWPWLTEPERMKRWMKGLVSVEGPEPAATRAGSKGKLVIKEGGRVSTYDETITAWEPNRRVAISMTGAHCPGIEMRCDHRLEDLGDATRLHYAFECRTSRTLFKVMGVVFGWFAKLQAKSFLKTLKRLAEAERAGGRSAVTAA
jgi:carbon monoxide dehydrogenase subunit G